MDYYRVEVLGDGIDHCKIFEGYEFKEALTYFFENHRSDRKAILTYVGEQFDDE